jgi:hypothetical protein
MNIIAAPRPSSRPFALFLSGFGLLFSALAALFTFGLSLNSRDSAVYQWAFQPIQAHLQPAQSVIRPETAVPIVWEREGVTWTLLPRADYQIAARVVGRAVYEDEVAAVVPFDLALGWGEMSDPAVDKWIRWRQADRWYYYQWGSKSPYKGNDIGHQSANVHIIPATDNLNRHLGRLRASDLILLEGLLVDVLSQRNEDSRFWYTSLSRTDSGGGACEIFYVTRLVFKGKEYR